MHVVSPPTLHIGGKGREGKTRAFLETPSIILGLSLKQDMPGSSIEMVKQMIK
jgi:hypothetical protein